MWREVALPPHVQLVFMFVSCPSHHFPALPLSLKLSQDLLGMFPLGWKHIYSECLCGYFLSSPRLRKRMQMEWSRASLLSPAFLFPCFCPCIGNPFQTEISAGPFFIPTEGATWLPTAISPSFFSNKLCFYRKPRDVQFSHCGHSLLPASQGDAQQWVSGGVLAGELDMELSRSIYKAHQKGERAHLADPLILSPSPFLPVYIRHKHTAHHMCPEDMCVFRSTSQSHRSGKPAIRHRKWLLWVGESKF